MWLYVKDMAALGYSARAESIGTVATKLTRVFTVDDLKAIAAFREEMAISGRLDLAGQAGHAASGAAGRQRWRGRFRQVWGFCAGVEASRPEYLD